MGINIHEYWRGFAAQRAALPPGDAFFIVSIESKDHSNHKPGVVVEVTRETAAKCLYERTHQLASEDQIAAYKQDMADRTERANAEEVKRKQQFALPKELNDLVIAVLANASNPPPDIKSKPKRGE
jgi:predicted phage tail protein